MLNPNKLSFMRQIDFIPVNQFVGLNGPPTITVTKGAIAASTEIALAADADDTNLQNNAITATTTGITGVQPPASAGTGIPVMQEITTSGFCGLLMEEAGDDVRHIMRIPFHWSRLKPIYVRILWCSDAAAVGDRDITWKFLYNEITPAALGMVAANPLIPLDTPFVAEAPYGTAYTWELTANGVINGGSIARDAKFLSFLIEMYAFDASFTENKYLVGVEFEYTPRWGRGHIQREAREWVAEDVH